MQQEISEVIYGIEKEKLESFDSMKLEGGYRMSLMNLPESILKRYSSKKTVITMSDNTHFGEVPEDIHKIIEEYQDEFKNLVYHVVHTHFLGMETYECLVVSPYREDWNYERPATNQFIKFTTMSHSINITMPENTETGTIMLENKNGVLVRVG